MARRHRSGPDLLSQIRRCQELIAARTGVDEFWEIVRLLLAKAFFEAESSVDMLDFQRAQAVLSANQKTVARFVEGGVTLSAPPEVINECLRTLASTVVRETTYETLDAAFEVMTAREYKSEKGQYFTPRHVVDFCIRSLRPSKTDLVCDPACGSAAFLQSAYAFVNAKPRTATLYGFDISRRAAKTADLMSFLACRDTLRIEQLDSLHVEAADLLKDRANTIEDAVRASHPNFRGFDVIATNPPFAGDVSTAEYSPFYDVARFGGLRLERDSLFVERCIQLLRPGGRLAIVLPDNKVSSDKFAQLRKWLLQRAHVIAVVSLHAYTFRPHTSQKAAIVFARKRHSSRDIDSPAIQFYRSDRPGKTSAGDTVFTDGLVAHDLNAIESDLVASWKL